ncbi:1,6-anhydro-N-acetylmuramyl-L-alanine amidase AmpD [Achromobacter aloeverae]
MSLQLDRHGWLKPVRGVSLTPSPNFNERPRGTEVSLLVIHNISLPPGEFGGPYIEGLFCNRLDYGAHPWFERLRGLRVAAHFLVRRDGAVQQFVSTDKRAWHAGASRLGKREGCNDFSVGIELEGTDVLPYTDEQYATLARLTSALKARYPLVHVWGHEHIAPGRKTDPGPAFDWPRFGATCGFLRRALPPG